MTKYPYKPNFSVSRTSLWPRRGACSNPTWSWSSPDMVHTVHCPKLIMIVCTLMGPTPSGELADIPQDCHPPMGVIYIYRICSHQPLYCQPDYSTDYKKNYDWKSYVNIGPNKSQFAFSLPTHVWLEQSCACAFSPTATAVSYFACFAVAATLQSPVLDKNIINK